MSKTETKTNEGRIPRAPQFKLQVTAEIIAEAKKKNSGHCMIADAIKQARPDARLVMVDLQTIRFTDPARGLRYSYLTPLIAQRNILDWDDGIEPAPYDVTLRANTAHVTLTKLDRKKRNRTDPALQKDVRARMKKSALVKTDNDRVPRRVGGRLTGDDPRRVEQRGDEQLDAEQRGDEQLDAEQRGDEQLDVEQHDTSEQHRGARGGDRMRGNQIPELSLRREFGLRMYRTNAARRQEQARQQKQTTAASEK